MSIPAETAMRQAPMTADYYMKEAVERIDRLMGDGYAKKHHELIAAFMNACVVDFDTAIRSTSQQRDTPHSF